MNERRGGWRGSRALAVGGLSALALACAASSSTAQEVAGTGDAAYQPSQPDYGGQFGIGVIATDRFAALSPREPVPLIRFLTEGTAIRAETRSSAEVVLFVARASRGKLVSKGQTRPFRLDAKAASTSSGMRLGSAVSRERLLELAPLARSGEATAGAYVIAKEAIGAAQVVNDPGRGFALLIPALDGASKDLRLDPQEDVLLVAVVPADATLRSRSKAGMMFAVVSPTGE